MIEDKSIEVIRTNPAQRETYRSLLESTVLKNGVKVVVADKECGITFHRRRVREERREVREKGFVETKRYININADACEQCLVCTRATGCPGLTFTETDFGRKVQTDLSWCVNDTACTKLDACPAFEELIIVRTQKPLSRLPELDTTDELPLPVRRDFTHAWHGYLAGVGGMGIGVSAATLVRAGHREGYKVIFSDKNGLAIRNGGVYSHITFLKPGCNHVSPIIPYGKADLMLGIDILEAARGIDPKGNLRVGGRKTRAIINRQKTPTINTLLGTDDFCVETLEQVLRKNTDGSGYFSSDVSYISERVFGTKLYANVIMLGIAFQRGELPLSLESLEYGIQETMGSAATENWLAFKLGRKIAHEALTSPGPTPATDRSYHDVVAEKSVWLKRPGAKGEQLAQHYWQLVTGAHEKLTLDARHESLLAQRIYDLIQYEDLAYAEDYVARLLRVHAKDSAAHGYAATEAALWNLHRVMAIKDEVYVAHLLSSEEKYEHDRDRYNVRPELGDRMIHRHLNRPEFAFGRHTLRFKMKTRPWMLRLMRRGKFLRRLLPAWHAKEKAFRAWYFDLADQFVAPVDSASYATWLKILRLPEEATGYREVRYPRMQLAQKRAEELLATLSSPVAVGRSLS
jgi:indolepyruvate ferredoxin oxidoreductase